MGKAHDVPTRLQDGGPGCLLLPLRDAAPYLLASSEVPCVRHLFLAEYQSLWSESEAQSSFKLSLTLAGATKRTAALQKDRVLCLFSL